MGFKAILSLKSKDELKDFLKKKPRLLFSKQNFFHNTYLNFFYLETILASYYLFLNLNFF